MHIWSLASLNGLWIWHCCELWCRSQTSSDPALLWLWIRPAATALMWFPAWELPYARSAALKSKKKKKKKKKKTKTIKVWKIWFVTKYRTIIWDSNPTPGHLSRQNRKSKGYMHLNVYCNTIYNSQDMEATQMSIIGRMDKENAVHIYKGLLLSHKKEYNNAICHNIDGPRDYHTKWRDHISYNNAYVESKKKWSKELIYKTETNSQILKSNLWLPKRNMVERDKLGSWD